MVCLYRRDENYAHPANSIVTQEIGGNRALGYSYRAAYLDEEILGRLENKPRGLWTEEDKVEYRSMQLARWETSGYPDWPEYLSEQGVAKVEHKNVLNSVFWLPLRYLTAYLNNEPNPDGPLIIQENGEAKKMGSKICLTVHDD